MMNVDEKVVQDSIHTCVTYLTPLQLEKNIKYDGALPSRGRSVHKHRCKQNTNRQMSISLRMSRKMKINKYNLIFTYRTLLE